MGLGKEVDTGQMLGFWHVNLRLLKHLSGKVE